MQIVSGLAAMFSKRQRPIQLSSLYPELFSKKQQADISGLTEAEIIQKEAQAWRTFLGV